MICDIFPLIPLFGICNFSTKFINFKFDELRERLNKQNHNDFKVNEYVCNIKTKITREFQQPQKTKVTCRSQTS